MRLTAAMLREHHACEEQVVIFAAEWPAGCEITEATLFRALELGLDIDWFACEFLPAPLLAEYRRQEVPLLAEYKRKIASLLAEYERQEAPLLAEFERKAAPFWVEYKRQVVPLIASLIAQAEAVVEARN